MRPLVEKGVPIAVVAPCGIPDLARLDKGVQIARARGYDLRVVPELLSPYRYLAGDDDHRVAQLAEALASPEYAAVWIARGGYGLTRILDRIDPEQVRQKPILGFSDVTALFCRLHRHGKGPLIHGPVVHSLPITDGPSLEQVFARLEGHAEDEWSGDAWVDGEARGWLCGGNLTLFASLCGTPWQVDARGAVVLLEEIGEAPYRMDRLLTQLLTTGFFDGVAAIGVGQLEGCAAPAGAGWTEHQVFVERLGSLGVPLIGNLPFGHGAVNRAFPWGAPAAVRGSTLTF